MAEEKVTTMVLHVDLQCSKCYKKVKKLLCKFPEVREQAFDEKANKVTIKVVSSSPEKIRDKLLCKGCGCIKSIEIIPPPPPKPKPKPPPKPEEKKPMKVSVDLQVQGFCYCKCCSGRPRGPCSCGGKDPCSHCWKDPCSCCGKDPCSCGGRGPCSSCWKDPCSCGGPGSCSCGGQVQCVVCHGKPVFDSWCTYGSGCEETQQGCSIM